MPVNEITGIRAHVEALIAMVEKQQYLEAIEKFYAGEATMQENNDAPRVGLPALLAGEQYALDHRLKTIHKSEAASYVIDGDRAAINWLFEYTDYEGHTFRLDEIAYQLWQDGKIVQERFYYDPARLPL